MTGSLPSAKQRLTNNTQQTLADWLNTMDAQNALDDRCAGLWAPREYPTGANMSILIDPGVILQGTTKLEVGGITQGTATSGSANLTSVNQTDGMLAGMEVWSYYYNAGTLTQIFAANTYLSSVAIATGAPGTGQLNCSASQSVVTGTAQIIVSQGVGGVVSGTTHSNNTVDGFPAGWLAFHGIAIGLSVSAANITGSQTVASVGSTSITLSGTASSSITTPITFTIPTQTVNPRIDRVTIDATTGLPTWTKGTPASIPVAPTGPVNGVPVCDLYIGTATTTLTNTSNIIDTRVINLGPQFPGGVQAGLITTANINSGVGGHFWPTTSVGIGARIGARTSDGLAVLQFVDAANSTVYGQISANSAGTYLYTTAGVAFLQAPTNGAVSIYAPATAVVAFTVNGHSGIHPMQTMDYNAAGPFNVGYLEIPPMTGSPFATGHTATQQDSGKLADMNAGTAQQFTIPTNATIAYPSGTAFTLMQSGAGALTIHVNTTDVLRWVPSGATGDRTLAQWGECTIVKRTSTEWWISGSGLT